MQFTVEKLPAYEFGAYRLDIASVADEFPNDLLNIPFNLPRFPNNWYIAPMKRFFAPLRVGDRMMPHAILCDGHFTGDIYFNNLQGPYLEDDELASLEQFVGKIKNNVLEALNARGVTVSITEHYSY
jgi:hypothetical protein